MDEIPSVVSRIFIVYTGYSFALEDLRLKIGGRWRFQHLWPIVNVNSMQLKRELAARMDNESSSNENPRLVFNSTTILEVEKKKGTGQKVQRDFSVFDSVPLRPMQTPPPTGVKGEIGFPVPARLLWPPSPLSLPVAFYLSNFPFCNFSASLGPIFPRHEILFLFSSIR